MIHFEQHVKGVVAVDSISIKEKIVKINNRILDNVIAFEQSALSNLDTSNVANHLIMMKSISYHIALFKDDIDKKIDKVLD